MQSMLFTSGQEFYNWYPLCKKKDDVTLTETALNQYVSLVGGDENMKLNTYYDIREQFRVVKDISFPHLPNSNVKRDK